ncbi:SipW-cognate class signal peptide [Granulicatella balaenopterae]|uniref:SipW-cognate class signal peptide n=1 Tax=Granulicatella balaenopterae TaxID=137733 RepID=A0A1H9LGI4_9LACT|nr:hypothetical protein [Granulicatella balaenopterae]SER10235.1 SipW-cognate class signal peptide [Granulicatella balaenopterae]
METQTQQKQDRKKRIGIVLLLLLCLLTLAGTMSWLTHSSQLDNQFTVGKISEIDPGGGGPVDPKDPTDPTDPIDPDGNDPRLDGNLFEPHWKPDAKLEPGVTIPKDPYVGVGKGSEACYVFVNVTDNMNNNDHVYFTLNDGWEVVEGTALSNGSYTSGLFMYTKGLDGSEASDNVWTEKAVFNKVVVDDKANEQDFWKKGVKDQQDDEENSFKPTITVQSYLHQKTKPNNEGEEGERSEISVDTAKQNAKEFFKAQ